MPSRQLLAAEGWVQILNPVGTDGARISIQSQKHNTMVICQTESSSPDVNDETGFVIPYNHLLPIYNIEVQAGDAVYVRSVGAESDAQIFFR